MWNSVYFYQSCSRSKVRNIISFLHLRRNEEVLGYVYKWQGGERAFLGLGTSDLVLFLGYRFSVDLFRVKKDFGRIFLRFSKSMLSLGLLICITMYCLNMDVRQFRTETGKLPEIASHPRSSRLLCKWEKLTVERAISSVSFTHVSVRSGKECTYLSMA